MKKLSKFLIGALMVAVLALGLVACQDKEEEKVLDAISISKAPSKVEYWVGDMFDATGMEVTAKYSNGDTEKVDNYTIDKKDVALTAADTRITVTYEGKTATQKITVKEDTEEFVIAAMPTKIDYTQNKTVDLTGMKANIVSAKNGDTPVDAKDLVGALDGDVVTVKYKDEEVAKFTVKTEERAVVNIGSQDWYGTTNQPNLLGTWDVKDDNAKLPTVDAGKGTVTFTKDTWARLPIFCVKYNKNDGSEFAAGNNIGAEVNDHVDGQTFNYSLNVNANGAFHMGFLLANSAVYELTDGNAMGIMLNFDGNTMNLSSNAGGGTSVVLATAHTQFENGKDNRVDFSFKRENNEVTFTVWVNGVRVYFNDVNMAAANASASKSTLVNGNYTFMAGRYKDEEANPKVETGYKNYGNRFGIYAADGTTVVLSDVK